MIGTEMKSEKNPFFLQVNRDRMEYFINPDILKNKYLYFNTEKSYSIWRCGVNMLLIRCSTLI